MLSPRCSPRRCGRGLRACGCGRLAGGLANTCDFFIWCGAFKRMERPLVRTLESDMPAKRDTPDDEYLWLGKHSTGI